MTEANRQLTRTTGGATRREVADLHTTLLRIIDAHALTAAQQIRWRLSHLNLSASNMRLDGGMLDLTTQRTHPRLPPVHPDHSLLDSETATYPDYADRTGRLKTIYQVLRRSTLQGQSELANTGPISIQKEMDRCYRRHLQRQLLCAVGLRSKVADSVLQNDPRVVERFTDVIIEMARLRNPSRRRAHRWKILGVAVLDIFHLLQIYPVQYFANLQGAHGGVVRTALRPIYKGSAAQIRRKRAAVGRLVPEFCAAYHNLLQAVQSRAAEYYGTDDAMRNSIQSRASFENRPLPLLFRKRYCDDFDIAIASYRSSGKIDSVRDAIDNRISASLRNIDQLLRYGQSQILEDWALELQIRIVDGVRYSVRAQVDSRKRPALHIIAPLSLLPKPPSHTSGEAQTSVAGLRYRFTTDEWKSSSESAVPLEIDQQTQCQIAHVTLSAPCQYGELQGYFCISARNGNKRGEDHSLPGRYAFALPDPIELLEMMEELAGTTTTRRDTSLDDTSLRMS